MNTKNATEIMRDHWWQVVLIFVGGVLIVTGIVLAQQQTKGEELIISEPSPSPGSTQLLIVDVEGAVEKPGIYKLASGARVGEAIVVAGGLAAQADRSYVARFINQAELLRDGMKLYIPQVGENQPSSEVLGSTSSLGTTTISINSASESDLDSLTGIGPARAKVIIEKRPYTSISELVTKAGIPQSVLDENQGKLGL